MYADAVSRKAEDKWLSLEKIRIFSFKEVVAVMLSSSAILLLKRV